MRQSIKSVCVLVGFVAFIVTLLFWLLDSPDSIVWITRIVAPVVMAIAVGVIIFLDAKKDDAPDFLQEHFGSFFNRNGFCFAFSISTNDGAACIEAYYQNQYAKPCIGQIALRPAKGFWMNRAKIPTITFDVDCDSGEFGCCRIPIAIPVDLQGRRHTFDVGDSVAFPNGKGDRLRFSDGILIRDDSDFGAAAILTGAASGGLVPSSHATVTLNIPDNISVADVGQQIAENETFWKTGDGISQYRG